jgi:hypothetical protein
MDPRTDLQPTMSGGQTIPISPVRNGAGEPVPRETLSNAQIRRKRLCRRRSSGYSDPQARSAEGREDAEATAAPHAKRERKTGDSRAEKREKKKERKRAAKRASKQESNEDIAERSSTGARGVTVNGTNGSMLSIIRGAEHVPAPKPRDPRPSRRDLYQPPALFGESEEDEDSESDG